MNNIEEKQIDNSIPAHKPSTTGLRGRQSVRATFRLSEACIDAISILSAHLGIKQKSVFDYLMEDAQVLNKIARELCDAKPDTHGRLQKTFVISRRSLSILDMTAGKYNASRDDLVEHSVRRLFPIVQNERIQHEKRKALLGEISKHFAEGEDILKKADQMVGRNDQLVNKLQTVMAAYRNAIDDINIFIERGKPIETFEVE